MNKKMTLKEWLPLLGMTLSAFIFNTSEFMPIGLLSDIAANFHMTEAQAGMMITVYSWTVTLLSLPLMLIVCKIDSKKLLLGTIALFGIGQLGSVFAVNFAMLMLARIVVACAHSIFWSIASPIAVQVVSKEHHTKALSMIITGTSIAMVIGMPLGRMIGLSIGWRMTFLCVGIIAFLTLIYLTGVFPKIEKQESFSIRELGTLLKNPILIGIYILNFLVATAYYTGYSYIEPFLKQIAGFANSSVTITLTIFGLSGLVGSYLFSNYYEKNRYLFIRIVMICIVAALLLLYPATISKYSVIILCAVWGMAVMAYNVTFQSELILCVPQSASSVAMAIFSAIFNMGIGCGTWFGGIVCTYTSIGNIGYAGGIVALIALLYCLMYLMHYMKRKESIS